MSYLPQARLLPLYNKPILFSFSGDEEMNIILFRLLEYLGHPNPFVCAAAHTEVRELRGLSIPFCLFAQQWFP